jgi:lipopolysaccharide export LptBFGC system permease protein LptF
MTPTLIRKGSRNPFLAAGKGIGFVATFFLAKLILQNLGQSGILPPVVAAWAPLLVYAPLAFSAAFDWREATVRVREPYPAPA